MKLLLFGGVQGVGKTTLLAWLKNKCDERIVLVNPGELFRNYHHIKTVEEIEEMVVEKLKNVPDDATVIAHWHYAVRRPSGYIPQIDWPRIKRMTKKGAIQYVGLFLITAPPDTIRKRRLKEYAEKKRPLSRTIIRKEIAAEEKFLEKHYILFSKALGNQNVGVFRLANNDLREAKLRLWTIFGIFLDDVMGR